MVIIFYDANEDQVYICTETDKTKRISINDPNLMDYVPNDDILYVSNGHFVTKEQFGKWLSGDMELNDPQGKSAHRHSGFLSSEFDPREKTLVHEPAGVRSKRLFLRTTAPGAIHIPDLKAQAFPGGLSLESKWQFVPLNIFHEDQIEGSRLLRSMIEKGKLEIVDEDFVEANKHKLRRSGSLREQSLNSILVPSDMKAEAVVAAGGLGGAVESSGGNLAWEGLVE